MCHSPQMPQHADLMEVTISFKCKLVAAAGVSLCFHLPFIFIIKCLRPSNYRDYCSFPIVLGMIIIIDLLVLSLYLE